MLYWDPNPDLFVLPFLDLPIKWYGAFFTLGFALCFPLFRGILSRAFLGIERSTINKIIDKLTLYIVLGTVLGARLGHFLFYEHPADYLSNPLQIFWIREGGLASHGGVVGIFIALALFVRKIDRMSWLRLCDLLTPCAALVAGFIRIGNFMNQEILGTSSHLPWAVVFGHPQDGSFPSPRHPVQLYEALFYFGLFILMWRMTYRLSGIKEGRLIGLFLILCFGFRFVIEFLKLEQSHLLGEPLLFSMGQWLSLPFIILGILFFKRPRGIMAEGEKL